MTRRSALVLGGGGVTGIAWEIGLLVGLAERGVDLSSADLVVGTSAGSVVAAHVTSGADLEERYAAQLAPPTELAPRTGRRTLARVIAAGATGLVGSPRAARARIGRVALAAETVPEADRLAVIASRLTTTEWPERELLITAVDAETGEFRVFDRDAGVPLVGAVAASCAVPGTWPPVSALGRRWIDGGMRSLANADLAGGCDPVVVLAPAVDGVGPIQGVDVQVEGLRGRAEVVTADAAYRRAVGRHALDPARRAEAARLGRAQAGGVAARVGEVWRSSRPSSR